MKQRDVSDADVVKRDPGVDPLGAVLGETGDDVGNDFGADALAGDGVSTLGRQHKREHGLAALR